MRVWHYTILDRFKSILLDGEIKPATAGVPEGETPAVWFSAQPIWEPTANKQILHRGVKTPLTTQQMFAMFGTQLIRLGMDSDDLYPWHILKRKAKISRKEQRNLIKAAELMGADPMLWYGSLKPVCVSRTKPEGWIPSEKRWEAITII